MSVKRYMNEAGSMVPRDNGAWMAHADYAALEARCAGLERENNTLRARADTNRTVIMQMDKTMEAMEAERDALQAKLAAAEEALRKAESWTDHIHTALAESLRPKQAVGEMVYGLLDFLRRAILAGHAPATSQTDHKRVWVGPGHLESTGYIDQPATKGEGDE